MSEKKKFQHSSYKLGYRIISPEQHFMRWHVSRPTRFGRWLEHIGLLHPRYEMISYTEWVEKLNESISRVGVEP